MSAESRFAVLLTLLALALRAAFALLLSLNPDECMHLNAASSQMWGFHLHPPFLLWWLWAASLLSEQPWWLRLLPTLAGALTPLLLGLWLRRFLTPITAWSLAALVAVSPNLARLSAEMRGYGIAMAACAAALYCLDRAFDERSPRWLAWHFAALYAGILTEFSVAWVALAAGLYGLTRLSRPLASLWAAGQAGGVALYGWLYFLVIRHAGHNHDLAGLLTGYLRDAFPQPGQHPVTFFLTAALDQLAYVTASRPAALLAAAFALLGLFAWRRSRNPRIILIPALYLAAAGAFAHVYPFGRSRHTMLIGLLSLAATGAGIDFCAKALPVAPRAAAALFLLLPFAAPQGDSHRIPLQAARQDRWQRAITEVNQAIPAGERVMTDEESADVWVAKTHPRANRASEHNARFKGQPMTVLNKFDFRDVPDETILSAPRPIWILDMGFVADTVKLRREKLGIATVVDEPGVLFLGRLP